METADNATIKCNCNFKYEESGRFVINTQVIYNIISNCEFVFAKIRIIGSSIYPVIVGDSKFDRKIVLELEKYNHLIVEHFNYLDRIYIKEPMDETILRNIEIPGNVVFRSIYLKQDCGLMKYKTEFLRVNFPEYVPDIGQNLEVGRLLCNVHRGSNINELFSKFQKISELQLFDDMLPVLDENMFSTIEIDILSIISTGDKEVNINKILSNENIKSLVLESCPGITNFIGDLSNNYNIVMMKLSNSLFCGGEIPPEIERNMKIAREKRFRVTKIALRDD